METEIPRRRGLLKAGIVVGRVLILVAIATAVLGPVIGIRRSFEKIEAMKSPTPADLEAGVRGSLLAVPIGIAIGLAGAVLFLICRSAQRRLDQRDPFAPPSQQ